MKKKIIFRYRLTSDTGFAPCVDNDLFTLACCKTHLRKFIGSFWNDKKINNDDYELYVLGAYAKKLLFFAKITKVIEMKEYYTNEKYSGRKDYIYEYTDDKDSKWKWKDTGYGLHIAEEDQENDIAGKYVLISDEFVYYGKEAEPCTDEIISYFPLNRGERPNGMHTNSPCDVLTEFNIAESEALFNLIKDFCGEEHLTQGAMGRKPHTQLELKNYDKKERCS